MNKEFIPYEQALELKELGFKKDNDFGLLYKGDDIPSILYQQAFRWFREKYGLMGIVDCFLYPFSYTYNINDSVNEKIILWSEPENDFETYEEAEKALLIKLIEITKQK
jgi:hypothetical protein